MIAEPLKFLLMSIRLLIKFYLFKYFKRFTEVHENNMNEIINNNETDCLKCFFFIVINISTEN